MTLNSGFTAFTRAFLSFDTCRRMGMRLFNGGIGRREGQSLVLSVKRRSDSRVLGLVELSEQPMDGRVPGDVRLPRWASGDPQVLPFYTSSHTTASNPISSHRIPPHRIASHLIASHPTSSHRIPPHRNASHLIASHASCLFPSHLIPASPHDIPSWPILIHPIPNVTLPVLSCPIHLIASPATPISIPPRCIPT